MTGKTAKKPSDFSWIYKGWKTLNKNTVQENQKIDISQPPLDKTQFFKRKSIREVLVSRIDLACIMIQWSSIWPNVIINGQILFICDFVVCAQHHGKKI
jgi:hypothetical protein